MRMGLALGLIGVALVVLFATPVGMQMWGLVGDPRVEHVQRLLAMTAAWMPLAVIGLMVLHTLVPLPAEILAVAAGILLGPFWGFLTVWIGAMLGAYLGFFLGRVFGQPLLQRLVQPERLDHIQRRLEHADTVILLIVRLVPVLSFNLINYALGLSRLGWWRFSWTTGVGIVPVTALMVLFGAHLHDWRILLLMMVMAGIVCLGGWVILRRRQLVPFPNTTPRP